MADRPTIKKGIEPVRYLNGPPPPKKAETPKAPAAEPKPKVEHEPVPKKK